MGLEQFLKKLGVKIKTLACILILALFAVCLSAAAASALEYVVTQLTDNDYADYLPEINDNGQAVWCGQTGTTARYSSMTVPRTGSKQGKGRKGRAA